ncbi:MAG: hypothetical protein GF353_17640 [Candidatus Lokiarchaeota archaeon]|nr:hypothetical protein [Candidatus Lokiarchaeota archaeon]
MTKNSIILAVEDPLSETVAKEMLNQSDNDFYVTNCLGKRGFGYIKAKIDSFNKAAKSLPFLILIDQDYGCPPEKIRLWLSQKPNPNLIFRVAVMEIESWVMADREAFAKFLSIPISRLPSHMDKIIEPKQFLINTVKRSRSKRLIKDIAPAPNSTAHIGPNYNARLSDFVQHCWNVYEAIKYSESLRRAFNRIQGFKKF